MAARTMEAKLVISGEDRGASASIAKVVQTVRQLEEAAKVSKPLEGVAKVLQQVEQASKATDSAMRARAGFDQAQTALKGVQATAQAAAVALDQARKSRAAFDGVKAAKGSEQAAQIQAATKAVRELSAAHQRAEGDVRKATAAIAAETATLQRAEAVASKLGADLGNLGAHQERLRAATDSATDAVRRQIRVEDQQARAASHHAKERAEFAKHQRLHGVVAAAATGASGYVGAHGIGHVIVEGAKAGAEVQSERVRLEAIRVPGDERRHIEQRSLELAARYRNVTQASVMELWKEMRSVMTDPHEVDHVIDPMVRAKSILDAQDKTGTASHGLNLLVKGAESIGAAKDPERFTHLLDGYVKAMQVMGKTITPEGIYEMQKYSKAAGARWSDRFILTTAQSLGQEMNGSTAGNSIQMAQKQIVGGMQNLHSKAKEFARIGLIDEKNLDYLKTGEVKGVKAGVKHAVKGDDLAATDLDKWVYSVLIPALKEHGVSAEGDQLAWVQKNFTGTAADVIAKMMTQRESFEAHARMYEGATGLEGQKLNRDDATAALGGLGKSIETFLGVLSSPVMKDAAHAMDSVSGGIGRISLSVEAFNKAHPTIAKMEAPVAAVAGLGAAGLASAAVYKAMTGGFGLKGSAVALDHSAAMLDAAAIKLAGGSPKDLVEDGAKVAAGGLAGAAATVTGVVAGGVAATVIANEAIKNKDFAKAYTGDGKSDDGGMLGADPAGYGLGAGIMAAPDHSVPMAPTMSLAPGAMPLTIQGSGISGFGLNGPTDPSTAGKEAGEKAGKGVADGIEQQGPDVESKGRSLFEKLKSVFSEGIFVPINFAPGAGGGAGLQNASFGGGGEGGGGGMGGLIHRASLGGGGGLGGLGGNGGPGNPNENFTGSNANAVRQAAKALGTSPEDLATVISYETIGKFSPSVIGGKGNRYQGLIQFGPRERAMYGADGSQSFGQQMGAVVRYLRHRGFKPGMGLDRLYATINGGNPYVSQGANDGNGTIAQHVERMRRGHAERARMFLRSGAGDEPKLVAGADGVEGLDLGNGSMRMPDGSVRPIPKAIPEPPPGGFGNAGRGGIGRHVEDFGRHVDRLADMGFDGQVQVSLSGPGASQARVTGIKARGRGGMNADMGISMPGIEKDLSDWA